jgi:2'-5' RNA ligase
MKIRTFVCVELPEAERERLGLFQARLRAHGARISWASTATMHLTLAFLGDVDESRVADVVAATERGAAAAEAFELRVAGCGGFPSLARPRVLWAGLGGDVAALVALQSRVVRELVGVGFPREERGFKPHLTLGRVKDDRDRALRAVADELARERFEGDPFTVAEALVMKSELHQAGARHTPLARAPLGAQS